MLAYLLSLGRQRRDVAAAPVTTIANHHLPLHRIFTRLVSEIHPSHPAAPAFRPEPYVALRRMTEFRDRCPCPSSRLWAPRIQICPPKGLRRRPVQLCRIGFPMSGIAWCFPKNYTAPIVRTRGFQPRFPVEALAGRVQLSINVLRKHDPKRMERTPGAGHAHFTGGFPAALVRLKPGLIEPAPCFSETAIVKKFLFPSDGVTQGGWLPSWL